MVAASLNAKGEFKAALPHAEEALAFYEPERHGPLAWRYVHDLGIAALSHLSIALWASGQIDRSLACERQALDLAEHLQHPNSKGYAQFYCGTVSAFRRRDFADLRRHLRSIHTHAQQFKMPYWAQFGMCFQGVARAAEGDVEEGIALIQEGIQTCERSRTRAFRPAVLAGLAEAQFLSGRLEEAEQTIDTALKMAEETFERWMDAELWRLKAHIVALGGRHKPEEAEALLWRAAKCAERQGSKPLHLRAMNSLAELWGRQGRRAEAYDVLVLAHDRFTEGFDTPDLKTSRALLGELRQ
jgi:predicted ATPase